MGKGTEAAKLDVIDAFPGLRYDANFEITKSYRSQLQLYRLGIPD